MKPPPAPVRRLCALVTAAALTVLTAVAVQTSVAPRAAALDNRLVRTPPMGFNDWNAFGCNVDEQLIKQTADFFVSSGLKAAGYEYVNIDDCWLERTRSADGHLVPDPVKFPDGIKGTADYVHSKGLKLGIYEDAGTKTCAGYPGSLGHEQTDANDFAAWGVDYLKYDNCNNQSDGSLADYKARYTAMRDALANTGRPIVYSLCEWGVNNPATWAGDLGNLWRTTGDISDNWNSLKSIISQNAPLAPYAHPGAFNDPDMLEVGNGGMTATEYRTHFALWAEMAAPLLIGTDLRKASAQTMNILTNPRLIAIDQDPLGVQGKVVASDAGTTVFSKPLANGDRAVALYNSNDSSRLIRSNAAQVGLGKSPTYTLQDAWSGANTESAGTIGATVPAHGTVIYRVSKGAAATVAPGTSLSISSPTVGASNADGVVSPGGTSTLTTTLSDYGRVPLSGVRVTLTVPDGWTATPTDAWTQKSLGTDRSLVTNWTVTAPATSSPGTVPVNATATYSWNGHPASQQQAGSVLVATPPPSGDTPLSDVSWVSASNGWGPVEKDTSNGETAAGDGKPITIRGTVYPKGLGTNAESDIVYYLGGTCHALNTDVGIDDEEANNGGDVIFQIYADNAKVADSGVLTNTSPVKSLTADLAGATWLRLHVDPDGPNTYDHGDWAGPLLHC
ncbi:MAG TPA: NPCBM/NEW2 domain-containing protein [Jatrophihabitans sp.]|jgi:alpha-galactosidase